MTASRPNDIGGAVNFANLSASGYEKAELYRGPNSALYGSDALASVLNLTTRRGVTPLPELGYSIDGGNFGTLHQEANLGGAWRRFDYFTDFSRFDTQNSTPNSEFHNGSYLGNLGWQLLPNTELRATVRRSVSAFNSANAIALYGIPDDGVSREHDTSFGVTLENRATARWHNLLRYAGLRLRSGYANFGPTGIPAFDPYGGPDLPGKRRHHSRRQRIPGHRAGNPAIRPRRLCHLHAERPRLGLCPVGLPLQQQAGRTVWLPLRGRGRIHQRRLLQAPPSSAAITAT